MSSAITEVYLPDGTPVLARISDADQLPREAGQPVGEPRRSSYVDAGLGDRIATQMASLKGLIAGVAASVAAGTRAARPDEVSVSFGIELAARGGKVVSVLADGEAKAAITVTLTWQGAPPEDLVQPE
jgi:hypothetical protein